MIKDNDTVSVEREVAVPELRTPPGHDLAEAVVLTLPESATFLRASEADVLELINNRSLPAEKVGGEWRLLKQALVDFLRFGPRYNQDPRRFPPPWFPNHPVWEEFFYLLEKRILNNLSAPERHPARGTKPAVLQHFGVFKEDADLDQDLASIQARRKAAGE
jgi:excisionase family DNA binding protein